MSLRNNFIDFIHERVASLDDKCLIENNRVELNEYFYKQGFKDGLNFLELCKNL